MKIVVTLVLIGLSIQWTTASVKHKLSRPNGHFSVPKLSPNQFYSSSGIKLLSGESATTFSPPLQNFGQKHYTRNEMHNKKSGRLSSLLKDMTKGISDHPDDEEVDINHPVVERDPIVLDHPGEGWYKPQYKKYDGHHEHKYIYNIKSKDKHSHFSILDFFLSALSLVSLGAFLLNLLAGLLSTFGFGFFTTTATYPTFTTGGGITTSTGTGGITVTGGGGTGGITVTGTGAGVLNQITSYFRQNDGIKKGLRKKKRKGPGRIQADAGVGGTKGWTAASTENDFSAVHGDSFEEIYPRVLKRKSRSVWEPSVDPYTSLDVAARSILNSIASVEADYECMERIICDSNRHAKIIGNGLEFFMPIFTFSTSYFGEKLGLHQQLPNHLSAIVLGVRECNCNSNFPQCSTVKPTFAT